MNERTHVDLFSGLGGFALAARANGIRTVQFCEFDGHCRGFLARAWPGVPCHPDVREFDGRGFAGSTYLLTAGVPCQPASRAGKQRGCEDDRWLWPQAVRVLSEVRPTWAMFENPPGIGDVGLAGILADVESQGYEVRVFSIPACAIGAPHRRERYWIAAHAGEPGREGADAEPGTHGLRAEHRQGDVAHREGDGHQVRMQQDRKPSAEATGQGRVEQSRTNQGNVANAEPAERRAVDVGGGHCEQRHHAEREAAGRAGIGGQSHMADPTLGGHRDTIESANPWSRYVWLPCADGKLRRAPDDSFGVVDGLHRSVLAALGNSIVPQVAQRVIAAMVEADLRPTAKDKEARAT